MEAFQLPRFLSDEHEPVMRIASIRVSDAVIDPEAQHLTRIRGPQHNLLIASTYRAPVAFGYS
jgi:hypothetical protein